MSRKREVKEKSLVEELCPQFASTALFMCLAPHSYLFYKMVWADACSDAFFDSFEQAVTWIAGLSALEGAAAVSLGFIDYKIKSGNDPSLIYAMRKKRLAFAKFSFIMAIGSLMLVDTPSPNAVVPLIIGSGWSAMKLGTQIGYNLTPEKFFMGRTFLSMYNLVFLLAVWYKLRQARREKMDLEFTFFQRVEGIMLTMANVFEDSQFKEAALDQ